MFANKIKRVKACIDARGHHFQNFLELLSHFPNAVYYIHTVVADRGYLYAVFELFVDSHPCGWAVRRIFTTYMRPFRKGALNNA
jgi:hypothetical protein